jgi:energy-coupling factor transport system substrate-specific component
MPEETLAVRSPGVEVSGGPPLAQPPGSSLRRSRVLLLAVLILGAAFGASAWAALDPGRAGLSLLLAAAALIAGVALWLETGQSSTKELAMVAALGAVAAAGRVLFAFVPGVQPVTVIAMASGAALGARAGAGVGAVAALSSNFFLGQGIWTPWQMLGWAACGAAGGLLATRLRRRSAFVVAAFVFGALFSLMMDVWEWYSFFPHTWQSFVVVVSRGIPFVLAHAIGNALIVLFAGPELFRMLDRYGRRLRTEVIWR